ncbi:HNH endonuclease family protein [Diaminobutyricibacter sp. McL0618]|uniref:HNH endonuclease family protein n=1 Tax=Leifsonia sp. McL0618 TaxID=3415677 RepID=UPI003CF01D76
MQTWSIETMSRRVALVATSVALLLTVTGCTSDTFTAIFPSPSGFSSGPSDGSTPASMPSSAPVTPAPPPALDPSAATADARVLLATLPVKGKAPKTGYDRVGDFGPAWKDMDHNGCDTRNDILARDLVDKTESGTCKVLTGILHDPYTGKTIDFVRGPNSADVQIDHRVPLANAWQTGAQQLTLLQREQLANDPLNLVAVDGPTNERKSDGDAATWLPPQASYRCTYVADQVAVKARYHLWVAPAEHDAIARVLAGCPVIRVPVPGH